MRGLVQAQPPGAMALAELPVPTPARGQILVRVEVSAVNEMDVQVRAGGWRSQVKRFLRRGPVVTGFEFAGVAQSSGDRIQAGQRVMGYVHVLNGPRVHAGLVCVAEADLAPIPAGLDAAGAAALVAMGLTAVEIVETIGRVKTGQTVLVIGAAGGVGVYAVQLAHAMGARVTAVCAASSHGWILTQGAAAARERGEGPPYRDGEAFDLIIDAPAASSFAAAAPYLKPGGIYVTTNPLADLAGYLRSVFSRRRAGYLMMLSTTPRKLARLGDLYLAGSLRPVIDSRWPLDQADRAFDRFATPGKRGRVLLDLA
jgi:NADPH:quinone reductase-like Zn-dependent oxidoreductase